MAEKRTVKRWNLDLNTALVCASILNQHKLDLKHQIRTLPRDLEIFNETDSAASNA